MSSRERPLNPQRSDASPTGIIIIIKKLELMSDIEVLKDSLQIS